MTDDTTEVGRGIAAGLQEVLDDITRETDMVERTARAACVSRGGCPDEPFIHRGKEILLWEVEIPHVRATLKAAFQSTDEDARAFFGEPNANGDWFIFGTTANFRDGMQALSDAALKEGS